MSVFDSLGLLDIIDILLHWRFFVPCAIGIGSGHAASRVESGARTAPGRLSSSRRPPALSTVREALLHTRSRHLLAADAAATSL